MILIIVLTVLTIGGSILIYRFKYVAGTRNDVDYAMYSFGLFLILYPLMAIIALCASILALISLVRKHTNISQIVFKLALILLGPVIVCCAFFFSGPGAAIFLRGFEQWVLQNADVDAIQIWLSSEGQKHSGQSYSSDEGFPEELPECLVKLRPRFISFHYSYSSNELSVKIIWFFVMDDYGLIIGSPTMEIPNKGHIKISGSTVEFRRPVKRGAYIFFRG
jgi:hypothetical protein